MGNNIRNDALVKVLGKAKYNDDYFSPSCLQARMLTSTFAHAEIMSIDASEACAAEGVHVVVTGADSEVLFGSILRDMPVLARDKVRYFGEPVAVVVADEEWQAAAAVRKIKVKYKPLPIVNSVDEALKPDSSVIHEKLGDYIHEVPNVNPQKGTNVSNRVKIRKGNMSDGWAASEIVIEAEYHIPQASHAYMETRNARAEILPDGRVVIHSASQGPHAARKLLADCFNLSEGSVVIHTPFVGGSYGGKVNPHPEAMAYIASRAVSGREVRVSFSREECFYSAACKIGAKAVIKLGADRTGKILALKADFYIDSGAYADTAPNMTKAAAANCSGAYNIPNIECDSCCVYTNHVYTTSFRGFGHEVSTFAIERTIEKLALKLGMDSSEIRLLNAYREGDYTPTQNKVTLNNTGNLEACINKVKELVGWENGVPVGVSGNIIRAKGMACFSKTSSSPTDASSSAVITFCSDGCVNLNCGVVECGPGMSTALPKILAERLKIDPGKIFINTEIDTKLSPEHWKTVASMSLYMAGSAILQAADDAIRQLKANAAMALRCGVEDVALGEDKIYMLEDPSVFLNLKEIVNGIKEPDGNAVGGPVIGRGHFVMKHLTALDEETGKGKPGPYWTVGAQAVEVEYENIEHSFRLIKAVTVLDAGRIIDVNCAAGQVTGAMNTG
ncbi:MAG: xanthine dehydrogenase family protein molybdopterin-binding subunit, partial [Bacillota bacterium]|nr:xanthine dehydrogenase family protein molybdopterin-binding subunit [Bacillota bacterium]